MSYAADMTKILTRRELLAILADAKRKAPRSKNTLLNSVIIRLAACCELRAGEIAQLHVDGIRVSGRPNLSAATNQAIVP